MGHYCLVNLIVQSQRLRPVSGGWWCAENACSSKKWHYVRMLLIRHLGSLRPQNSGLAAYWVAPSHSNNVPASLDFFNYSFQDAPCKTQDETVTQLQFSVGGRVM